MRKKIVIGNWKMVLTNSQAIEFVDSVKDLIVSNKVDVVFCPSYVSLNDVRKKIGKKNIKLGAQNVHYEKAGSYTGEISIDDLADMNVSYVIIGHSERRNKLGETDEMVNKKVILAIEKGITPIVCVGENTEERTNGVYLDKVEFQIRKALDDVSVIDASKVIIAYEPVWAISTSSDNTGVLKINGKIAEEMAESIRYIVQKLYGPEVAENIRVIFGGSVSSETVQEYLETDNIDGVLVGAKSIKSDIIKIVEIANEII